MDQTALLKWYKALSSRIVDLVGDFTGDELFIIEGDSLLLHCFSNEKLDFYPGFQVLHATYLVEKFLQKLQQRKCVFEIVFFAQNARLCIPAGVHSDLHDRYLFAREAMIQHLVSVSHWSKDCLRVQRFDDFESDLFEAHLMSSGAYLFMCHDGAVAERKEGGGDGEITSSDDDIASSDDDSASDDSDSAIGDSDNASGDDANASGDDDASVDSGIANDDGEILSDWGSDSEETDSEDENAGHNWPGVDSQEGSRVELRLMIHWFVAHGYNIALINSLEFRDTKVMAMVIEGLVKPVKPLLPTSTIRKSSRLQKQKGSNRMMEPYPLDAALYKTESLLERAIREQPGLTQRQCLVVVTLSAMLSSAATSPDNTTTIGAESMLLHLAILQNTQLANRAIQAPKPGDLAFFNEFLKVARLVLSSTRWEETIKSHHLPCDLSDLIDGRMFFEIQRKLERPSANCIASPATLVSFNALASLVGELCGVQLQCGLTGEVAGGTGKITPLRESKMEPPTLAGRESQNFMKVLPFKNAVFDNHLKPVHLEVDESIDPASDLAISKEFQEKNHWHNNRPLSEKGASAVTAQKLLQYQKRNQRYMTEMRQYATSLLGSAGMSQQEVVVVESSGKSRQKPHSANVRTQPNPKPPSGPKKKGQPGAGKPTAREIAAAAIQQKAAEAEQRQRGKWMYKLQEFAKSTDPLVRFTNVSEYLSSLLKESRRILEPEILTYLLDTLVRVVFAERRDEQSGKSMLVVTHIWEILTRLMRLKQGISIHIAKYAEMVCQVLGLPTVQLHIQSEQPLSFEPFAMPKTTDVTIGMSAVEFQLSYGGPFMTRTMSSLPDPRTPDFEPDLWQRDVLDQIDAKKSVFIVAPTSAGKTFISFYAMRQILKEDDDGILVYVAPTKALVNQIAAEVQARFSKSYPAKSTKSVWAIHTRDHRINNPMHCQILITVPHILQIMLLAPSNANGWTPRLRRIIFDEVHCIGQADDGVVWEQLLLMSPCPIIALSATVGNPQEFQSWLKHAQGTNGFDLKMIQHQHRYSDLRKYLFCPPRKFSFSGFSSPSGLSHLGLDEADDMKFIHPALSLVDRSRGIPDDFSLEPRDCLTLWKAMRDLQTDQFPVDASLDPSVAFSNTIIQKRDVIEWQKPLKQLLSDWMKDRNSPFEALLRHLSQLHTDSATKIKARRGEKEHDSSNTLLATHGSELLHEILPLVCSLHAQQALPALFFNYDRNHCEETCRQLLEQLQKAEAEWKAKSPMWKTKVDRWNEWKVSKEEAKRKSEKEAAKKKSTKKKERKEKNDDEKTSREDQIKESASLEGNPMELFDPEKPVERFSLADYKKVTSSEFSKYVEELKWRRVPKWLVDALERGIGVHHAGMNRKYRQVCEILFRKGFLRVVIATGTLALGINMPCKTVVFSGDSIFLTALNFRQASGRAGRRGFDMLGNVVFHHVPTPKIHRLISSRLPDLNGHFPITTSLVLRLFILLHGSNQGSSAVNIINSILSSPRICLGGPEMKDTVLHYLRFSIEYLRRNHLLDKTGAPLNFAGCISHLYYTESASFAFHALLSSGYFHELCRDIDRKPKKTLRTLMLVMSHLFGRLPLRQSTLESYHAALKRASSVVVLPPLPKAAANILRTHNNQVLDIYTGYVSSFIDQHVQGRDCCLPFSGVKCGGDESAVELGLSPSNKTARITSSFFALSGHGDRWDTVSDLSEMVRSGVWLEESVIPYIDVSPEGHSPLNAYLYDFFKHGNVQQLENANGVRRGDIWFLLNDFSLVLATLNTALNNFLKPQGSADTDILDVVGGGDARGIEAENKVVDEETNAEDVGTTATRPDASRELATRPAPIKKGSRMSETVENWEDEMLDDLEELTVDEQSKSRGPKHAKDRLSPELQPEQSLDLVCKAFKMLQNDFDGKFKGMWA